MDGDRLVLRQGYRRKRQAVNDRPMYMDFICLESVGICGFILGSGVRFWCLGLPGMIHASRMVTMALGGARSISGFVLRKSGLDENISESGYPCPHGPKSRGELTVESPGIW